MKRIVTLALTMLIGSYGAAHAQSSPPAGTETETATKEFLGLKWGLGIGVMGSFGGDAAVEKASIVGTDKIVQVDEEGDLRPQLFLEMHAFVFGNRAKCWREYQQVMSAWRDTTKIPEKTSKEKGTAECPQWTQNQEPLMPKAPLIGFGPFVAVQSSDSKAIDAFALGVMCGFRKDPKASSSVNVGIGVSFDPSVQVLGHGFKEGAAPPPGETAVRFKKEGQFGWVLMTSFTF